MPEVNEGWEARYQAIKEYAQKGWTGLSYTHLLTGIYIAGLITVEEYNRSLWKIKLLDPFVTRMMVNMIKGTLKYPNDEWSAEMWQDMGMDDKVDSINYGLLFEDHLHKRGVL